jgi:polygalacturonase
VSKRGYRYDASQSVSMASTLVADEPMPSVTPTSAPPSDAVNVRDFGAAGDGSTDDTQAINSALSAAAGKTLYFPAGAYRVTSTLYLRGPLRLRGDGAAASVVSWPGNMILFDVLNTADVTIEQLGVTGNYPDSSWGYAVVAGDTSRLKIDGCAFKNTPETAVSLWGVDDVSVTSTRFENIAASGVRLENAQLNENVVVRDCVFVGVNAAQISGHAAVQCHGSVEALHRNVWIERNHIESRGVGLGLDSINYGTIANNRIIGPNDWAVEGIAFSGSNNTLLGNEINNARAAGILLWAVASQPNDNNLIDANHCYDNQLGIGIACDKGTPSVTNLTITRNTCFDTDSGSQDQSYGVQWYVDTNYGGATFTWSNIQVTYNDLSGNLVGPWIFDGGVEPYFEGNKV